MLISKNKCFEASRLSLPNVPMSLQPLTPYDSPLWQSLMPLAPLFGACKTIPGSCESSGYMLKSWKVPWDPDQLGGLQWKVQRGQKPHLPLPADAHKEAWQFWSLSPIPPQCYHVSAATQPPPFLCSCGYALLFLPLITYRSPCILYKNATHSLRGGLGVRYPSAPLSLIEHLMKWTGSCINEGRLSTTTIILQPLQAKLYT